MEKKSHEDKSTVVMWSYWVLDKKPLQFLQFFFRRISKDFQALWKNNDFFFFAFLLCSDLFTQMSNKLI